MRQSVLILMLWGVWAQFALGQWGLTPGEILALQVGDTLRVDETLAAEIDADLAAIHESAPGSEVEQAIPPWSPFSIIVKVTDAARDQYLETGAIPDLEALMTAHGGYYRRAPGSLRSAPNLAFIEFEEAYNIPLLLPEYQALESLEHATVDGIGGDGSTIVYFPAVDLYAFRKAWGDCPAGCIFQEFRYFVVDDDELVTEVEKEEATVLAGLEILTSPVDVMVRTGEEISLKVDYTRPDASAFWPEVNWEKLDRSRMSWERYYLPDPLVAEPVHEGLYRAHVGDFRRSGLSLYSEPFYIQVDELDPVLWRRSHLVGQFWAWDWIGLFYGEHLPWIYVSEKGWFYSAGSDENAALWNPETGWLWTSSSAFPWVWSYNAGTWTLGL